VEFEHYDGFPDTTREGDVRISGDFRAEWFTDPDRNMLNVTKM